MMILAGDVSLLFLLAVASYCLLASWREFIKRRRPPPPPPRHLNLPPGPPRLPFIGNLHQFSPLLHVTFSQLSRRHGPILSVKLGRLSAVVVSSADLASKVLGSQDLVFCSRPALTVLRRVSYDFLNAAFSPYDNHWRVLRKLYAIHLFSSNKLATSRHVREDEVGRMVNAIATAGPIAVDLSNAAERLTTAILSRLTFGEPSSGWHERFRRSVTEVNQLSIDFFAEDYFAATRCGGDGDGGVIRFLCRWVDELRGLRRRLEKTFWELDALYDEMIGKRVERLGRREVEEEEEENRSSERCFTDTLLHLLEEKQEEIITMESIKATFTDVVLGGSDTTAATVGWAMAELMNNPPAMKKAVDEVRGLTPSPPPSISPEMKKKNDNYINFCTIREEDLCRLPYLKQVVNETLRLHPPGPLLLPREAMKMTKLGDYDVAAGTTVFVNVWAIARDPSFWENPEQFLPERFEEKKGDQRGSVDYKGRCFHFLPFGSGRRICPALQLAATIVELTLANLLYAFQWSLPSGPERRVDMTEAVGTVTHLKTPLHLVATNYSCG